MKKLVVCFNQTWSPHFETDLEIIKNLLDQGDDVYVLTNKQSLPTISNPEGLQTIFLKEMHRLHSGLSQVKLASSKIMYLAERKFLSKPQKLNYIFSSAEELKKFRLFDIDFGLAVMANVISLTGEYTFKVTPEIKRLIDNFLKTSFLVYESFCRAVNEFGIEEVYIFNGRYAEYRPCLQVCEKLGISFFTHERGSSNYKYALRKNVLPHSIDYTKAEMADGWGSCLLRSEDCSKKAAQWFQDQKNRIEAYQWVSFTKKQKINLLPVGFDKIKKNIAFFNSSLDEYESIPEWKSSLYSTETDLFQKIFDYFCDRQDLHFYLRVHPHLSKKGTYQVQEISKLPVYSNVTIIGPEDKIDTYALLEACDTIVVTTSTIGVEACYWGKPVVLLGRALYEDLDCTYNPKSFEEVVFLIDSERLEPKDASKALEYGLWVSTFGTPFKYYQPKDFFKGTFLGHDFNEYEFGTKDKILHRFYSHFDNKKMQKFKKINDVV